MLAKVNNSQSNLASARLIMSYAKRILSYLLSYSPGTSTRREVGPESAFGTPILGRGGLRGSAIVLFKRATVVSYKLSIVTIALSLTVRQRNLPSNVSDA